MCRWCFGREREISGGGDDGTCRGEIKANVGERSNWNNSCVAGDRVEESNRFKNGQDGENGVRNNGKNDVRKDRKNGKEDDDWVFDVDSNSNNEGNREIKANVRERSDGNNSGDGKIAGDRVKESNHLKNGQDGRNFVRNDGKNDVCNNGKNDVCKDRKNGKENDDWVLA